MLERGGSVCCRVACAPRDGSRIRVCPGPPCGCVRPSGPEEHRYTHEEVAISSAAAGTTGQVLVIEHAELEGAAESEMRTGMDLRMLAFRGGHDR